MFKILGFSYKLIESIKTLVLIELWIIQDLQVVIKLNMLINNILFANLKMSLCIVLKYIT